VEERKRRGIVVKGMRSTGRPKTLSRGRAISRRGGSPGREERHFKKGVSKKRTHRRGGGRQSGTGGGNSYARRKRLNGIIKNFKKTDAWEGSEELQIEEDILSRLIEKLLSIDRGEAITGGGDHSRDNREGGTRAAPSGEMV